MKIRWILIIFILQFTLLGCASSPNIYVTQLGKCYYNDGKIAKFEITYRCSGVKTTQCTKEVQTSENVHKYKVGKEYRVVEKK